MLPNRPYLLRAFYEWIVDSGCTPVIIIDANFPNCKVPQDFIEDGEIVFNISPTAVRDLKLGNEYLQFTASFSGVIHVISAPIAAVLSIYAEENSEGIFFDAEEEAAKMSVVTDLTSGQSSTPAAEDDAAKPAAKGKPFLKLVE